MSRALRIARADLAWSRKQLARVSGVPEASIWSYEAGRMKPSATNLAALRAALGQALDKAELHYGRIETRERGALRGVARARVDRG